MKIGENRKQIEFMKAYEPIHDNFVRFCKARSHGVMCFEDLVNESVLKVYQHWDNLNKKEALLYFLFSTARNIILNTIRKKKEQDMNQVDFQSFHTENSVEKDLEITYLYQQLNKLSDTKKEALILFEINGFSIREIAEIQGTNEGAVKVMLSRARKELKDLMLDEPRLKMDQQTVIEG